MQNKLTNYKLISWLYDIFLNKWRMRTNDTINNGVCMCMHAWKGSAGINFFLKTIGAQYKLNFNISQDPYTIVYNFTTDLISTVLQFLYWFTYILTYKPICVYDHPNLSGLFCFFTVYRHFQAQYRLYMAASVIGGGRTRKKTWKQPPTHEKLVASFLT